LTDPPAAAEVFRIGGLVQTGSLHRDGTDIRFAVTDTRTAIPVHFVGVPPDLFAEGKGVVALGSYRDGRFEATQILAKHDQSYMPKEVVDALKAQGVYVDPDAGR
jgi:cytochrome c-type biogenesis protein CcmE